MVAPDLMTAADVAAASKGQVSAADPRLPALIAAASQAVRDRCGWHVTPVVSETLTVDGTGGVLLDVRSGRLLDVSEVRVGGVDSFLSATNENSCCSTSSPVLSVVSVLDFNYSIGFVVIFYCSNLQFPNDL